MVVGETEPDNISKINTPDKETESAQNKKHHRKGDTSIIQETLFKAIPEDTTSIKFVNAHTTRCSDSIIPSRKLIDFKLDKSQKSYIGSGPRNIEQKQDDITQEQIKETNLTSEEIDVAHPKRHDAPDDNTEQCKRVLRHVRVQMQNPWQFENTSCPEAKH